MTDHLTNDIAGAGSPAPAMSSESPAAGRPGVDVVAPKARVELDRIRRRWGELPLERAEAGMPALRLLLTDLAPRSSQSVHTVADLGPAVVIDQLVVLVWDAYAAGRGDGIPELLTAARRGLA